MAGDGIFSASSDSREANGRLLGPTSDNPYESRGAGVARAFQNPDGSRPQDRLQPISVPRWNDQASEGQQNLDALASENQAQVKQFEAANSNGGHLESGTGAGADAGAADKTSAHRQSDHSAQAWGIPAAVLGAAAYAQLIHPPLQHALIPGQLKADALADTGELTKLQKVLQASRKSFLRSFSPPYLVHSEVRQISSAENSLRQSLGTMKQDAQAHIEALQLKGAAIKELKKLAGSEPSESVSAKDIQKAMHQVKYLEDIKSSRTPGQTLSSFLPDERARLSFLNRQKDYLPGGTANEAHLNWTQFGESMKKSNAFSEKQIQPVMDLAAKEKPFFQLGKMKLAREELQSFSKGMEDLSVSDFFKYSDKRDVALKIGKKFVGTGLIVGAESAAQCSLSDVLANNQHETLARIVQPTIPGAFLKGTALLCSATPEMKRATFAAAQLYELESNMTPLERLGTVSAGLLPSAILIARNNRGLAVTLGVVDVMIGAAAQLTSAFNSDSKLGATKHGDYVSERLASHAQDRSQSTMASDVQWLEDIGRNDPYGLTNIFDNEHKKELLPALNSSLDDKAKNLRNQMVIGEALGETILSHGLTTSQYSKMMNPTAPLDVPMDRKEEFQIAPSEHIDIGGRAVRGLMGAIGSANLLEATLAHKPSVNAEEIDAVEKRKQVMVEEVDHLLNDFHGKNFEGVLKDDGQYSMLKPINEYDLTEFWKHDPDKYSHLYKKIRETAQDYYEHLPRMQEALNAAQSAVDDDRASPLSNTSSLAHEKMLEARKYAFNTTAALTGKLYRDEALMELAQAECYVADSGKIAGESAKAVAVLGLAATALHNSELFAPGNADCTLLGADITVVYHAARAL
jgi:hypothetical protein